MPTKHDSEQAQKIADEGIILRTHVGSGLHGITVSDQDDTDHMGICIEPREYVIGLGRVPITDKHGYIKWQPFEQYEFRTQEEGVRSGPGDLDYTCYSLRKWTQLAANGNPTVLLMLFAPDEQVVHVDSWGRNVRTNSGLFLSRESGYRFKYYLQAQKERLLGERNQRTNRPELKQLYGFDSKFAYHACRLGAQGVELLTTGRLQLPMPEPAHTWLTDLRLGKYTLEEAIAHIEDLQYILQHLAVSADLPPRADMNKINKWLSDRYLERWEYDRMTITRPTVLEAILQSPYNFRTVGSLVKETGLSEGLVRQKLEEYEKQGIVRRPVLADPQYDDWYRDTHRGLTRQEKRARWMSLVTFQAMRDDW